MGLTLIIGTTIFIHISIDVSILGHIYVLQKKVLEPADVMVYHWSKPTLGRTWFEVEIKILLSFEDVVFLNNDL